MARQKRSDNEGYDLLRRELKEGVFRPLYIFYGEEDYLRENYRKQLRTKTVSGPAEDFNYHRFTEENWDIAAFSEAMEAIPMMSERSLVEVVDVDPFSRPEGERQQLAELFAALPEYCTVLYVYDTAAWKPDKRMKKLWSALEAAALQVEFPRQSEGQLVPWVRRHLHAGQKVMADDLIRYLILLTGGSMTTLAAELQKLISYTDQPEITRNDVDAVVIPVMEAVIFDITRDIGRKDFDGALGKLRDLLRQDVEPIAVNAVIGRQLRQLYGAALLTKQGRSYYDLASLYGIRDFAAREVYGQARGFSLPMLKKAMLLSARTDYAMKTSSGDAGALLEMLVLHLAEESR